MNKSILIIDDEENVLRLLKDHLEEGGYHVKTAISLKEGRETLERMTRLPDVMLLDVKLPDGSGMNFLLELRTTPRTEELPIILMSAHHINIEDKVKGFKLGTDDYLIKPFDLNELSARLDRIVNKTKGRPQDIDGANKSSAQDAAVVLTDLFSKPKQAAKPQSSTPSVQKISAPKIQPTRSPQPLMHRIKNLFLKPSEIMEDWKVQITGNLIFTILGIFSVGMGIQNGAQQKSLEVTIASIFGFYIAALSLTALAGWGLHWVMGLKQKTVSFKDSFLGFGVGWTPLALASIFGIVYVIWGKGSWGEFTGGPLLIFPTQSTSSFIGFLFRRIDIYEIWGLMLAGLALSKILGIHKKRSIKLILGIWFLFILVWGGLKNFIG